MKNEPPKPSLISEISDETFQTIIRRPFISAQTREALSRANVLLVPNEGFGDKNDLIYFPAGTTELFGFLKEKQTQGFRVDICIEEQDYKEVALHFDWMILATFMVSTIVAPLFVNLLTEYVKEQKGKKVGETVIKQSLILVDEKSGKSVRWTYEGPAAGYHDALIDALTTLASPRLSLPPTEPPKVGDK